MHRSWLHGSSCIGSANLGRKEIRQQESRDKNSDTVDVPFSFRNFSERERNSDGAIKKFIYVDILADFRY